MAANAPKECWRPFCFLLILLSPESVSKVRFLGLILRLLYVSWPEQT